MSIKKNNCEICRINALVLGENAQTKSFVSKKAFCFFGAKKVVICSGGIQYP